MKINLLTFVSLLVAMHFSALAQQPLRITVDQHGHGDYTTIQEAIYSVRDHFEQPVEIFVHKGIYQEKVLLPAWKRYIHLTGEDRDSTIIRFDDYSGRKRSDGFRNLEKINTYNSYTLLVQGNDVVIKNLTIENTAGPVGQAVALHLEGDRIVVRDCNILGWQDTFYLSKDRARNYIENCLIRGSTDFIFGAATALFKSCDIVSLTNSYITAASTTRDQEFGFIFESCYVRPQDSTVNKVYLGRPWRPFAKTYFVDCELGAHIASAGWDPWDGDAMFPNKTSTVDYREYGSRGRGAATDTARVPWAKIYTQSTSDYTPDTIFKDWKPFESSGR